jgi:phosphate-selective porin OprO/OprP
MPKLIILSEPLALALATLPLLLATSASAQTAATNGAGGDTLADRISALEQRVSELDRQARRLADSLAAASATRASAANDGFSLRSADGRFQLRLRGYLHSDARVALDDPPAQSASTFLLRRVRPVIEATLHERLGLRLMPDFAGGDASIQDAFVELRLAPAFAIRSGKFKAPFGSERLQSANDLDFVERAHPTSLAPNRDVGLQFFGEIASQRVEYAAGWFNGVPDGSSGDIDGGNGKDFTGRVFIRPLRRSGPMALRGLGIGAAASTGTHRGTAASPFLPAYRSPAQRTIVAFRADGSAAGTAIADGDSRRASLQASYHAGPFGLTGERTRATQVVRIDDASREFEASAWHATVAVSLTGERATDRALAPRHAFDPSAGRWGGVELVVRTTRLEVDDDAFPVLLDPATSIHTATTNGVGINWSLTSGVRLMVDYLHTRFRGGASSGDRKAERVILTRLQHSF